MSNEAQRVACEMCGLPVHKTADDDFQDWRHVGSGSIFCAKKRGTPTTLAAPPAPEAK